MNSSLRFPMPDDMHLHVRDGERLWEVVRHTTAQFGRAIIMPNLAPKHITTVREVLEYREKILAAVPKGVDFTPLMTVSLSKEMTSDDLGEALACEHVYGAKLYAGHTTNSEGVTDVKALAWMFESLEKAGKPLLIHGEAGQAVDVFDREQRFYENEMVWILEKYPHLRIVCEHITTAYVAMFVRRVRDGVVATITPQHLLSNRNDMLGKGGIRPHYYCMPILKKESDRVRLLDAATSGDPKFFLGTDSAPHPAHGRPGKAKETSCGCAGCFTAPHALSLYAEAFDSVGKIEMLPDFASRFGREFYGLPASNGEIELSRDTWELPVSYEFGGNDIVVPFRQEVPLAWRAKRV
jgi:dihydroorotase